MVIFASPEVVLFNPNYMVRRRAKVRMSVVWKSNIRVIALGVLLECG